MPPQKKVTKEDIIEAAFSIAKESGLAGITARKVAEVLNCSVAPIYVNFAILDDLRKAVVQRAFALSDELLAKQKGDNIFECIGKASLTFAREYPVLLRELILQPNPYMNSYDVVENSLLTSLIGDKEMANWTMEERRKLLLKMKVFQTGLELMIANGDIPSWLKEDDMEDLLMEVGGELFFIQKMKHEGEI